LGFGLAGFARPRRLLMKGEGCEMDKKKTILERWLDLHEKIAVVGNADMRWAKKAKHLAKKARQKIWPKHYIMLRVWRVIYKRPRIANAIQKIARFIRIWKGLR
jgi:hypothetical protein